MTVTLKALAFVAASLNPQTDDGAVPHITLAQGTDPFSYDMGRGEAPPGIIPFQTPQEFFSGPDGQRFLNGLSDMANNFLRGYEDGSNFVLSQPQFDEPVEPITSDKMVGEFNAAFNSVCVSYRESDMRNCTRMLLNGALTVGRELIKFAETMPPQAKSLVQKACIDIPQQVNRVSPQMDVRNFMIGSWNAAQACLDTVDAAEKTVNLDFLPDVTAILQGLIDQGNSGSIDFRTWAPTGRNI